MTWRTFGVFALLIAATATSPSVAATHAAEDGATSQGPFEELRRDPLAATPSGGKVDKLVDLTASASEPISLSDGASYVDTALVARNGRLLGLFARSDGAFDNFISPASNVLFFEDPRTLTEVRLHFANQWIPGDNPVFQGGNAQFIAAQARVALTQRLSIIAAKDGYFWIHPGNPAVADSQGFADVTAGLKYNVIRNPQSQFIGSVGGTYTMATGSSQVFQGNGDGEFHLFTSAGKAFFSDLAHWNAAGGLRLPSDTAVQSSMWYLSQQWDVKLTDRVYFLTGINWFHWFEAGNTLPVNFEGQDLFNLGSTGVRGNDIVTSSIGLRFRFGRINEAGICYEMPLTDRRDLVESRLYTDLCIRF